MTSLNNTSGKRKFLSVSDIVIAGAMVAVIEVSKAALSFLPNIELTSFWLIIFTVVFGWQIIFIVPVFILIEGMIYGMGLWWIMYLYVWPILVITAFLLRRNNSAIIWACISGFFGLAFGFLCSFVYVIAGGLKTAFAWWIAGIPWDIVHCVGNFVLMLILYKPIMMGMQKIGAGKFAK